MKHLWTLIFKIYLKSLRLQGPIFPNQPWVLGLWHQDLIASMLLCKGQDLCTLVSKSKDGTWLTKLLESMNFKVYRGSSSRSFSNLKFLRRSQAQILAMALDGPRGPALKAKEGSLWLAHHCHRPLYYMRCKYSHTLRLNSWDRFCIPLPFSTIEIHLDPYEHKN